MELFTVRCTDGSKITVALEAGLSVADRHRALKEAVAAERAAGEDTTLWPVVTSDIIRAVVSRMAGVPVISLDESNTTRLRGLRERLGTRVIGQDEAVKTVAAAVRRRRVGLNPSKRPVSFLFAGPTGVGKSELAKALAEDMFTADAGIEEESGRGKLLQFDMSEFNEKHTVSRLIGSPPGYVGHDAGGQLSDALRSNPYAVVLLDEIDKAAPAVLDVLLQILEDGRLTDGRGRVIDCSHAVFILTSNHGGAAASKPSLGFGSTATDATRIAAGIKAAVKEAMRPEIVNRLDAVVVFNPLDKVSLTRILELALTPIRESLRERGYELSLTEEATDAILAAGYQPEMGARPLRRAVTNLLDAPITDALLDGDLEGATDILVDAPAGAGEPCRVFASTVEVGVPA